MYLLIKNVCGGDETFIADFKKSVKTLCFLNILKKMKRD